MDDTLTDYASAHAKALEINRDQPYPQSEKGFFLELKPIDGGIEIVKQLREEFDVWILSAPSIRNPLCYTEKRLWIEKYFGLGFCDRLILATDKSLLIGDLLIDDYIDGAGQERFCGKLIQYKKGFWENEPIGLIKELLK